MQMRLSLMTCGLALLLAAPWVSADNSTKVPGYTIHHNALTTDSLPPAVASSYQIRRSKNRALLNVSIIKDSGEAVSAEVKATARNLMGQIRDIPVREIREGEAIYYIGDFLVANRENLTFDLKVQPAGSSEQYQASLTQEFYTD